MEEHDIELIERYYRHALTGPEQTAFQERLSADDAFREAVELHADALDAIRREGSDALRARLGQKGRELDAQAQQNKPWPRWLTGILVLLAVVFTGWWLLKEVLPAAPPAPVETPATPPDNALPPPPIAPATPRETPAPTAPPEKKTPGTRQLFAAAFEPYKDASLEPARRGAQALTPSEQFQRLYWEGRYQAALDTFGILPPAVQNNDNLLFIKANCLLATGRATEAAALLDIILRNDRTRFMAQANWYLALSQLRSGKTAEARTRLQAIASDPHSPRQPDAKRLLRAWK